MGCFLGIAARVGVLVAWLATSTVSRAFNGGWLLPLLGLVFLPVTTLAYVAVYAIGNGVSGWAWLWVVLGCLFDVGTQGRASRRRFPRYRASQHGATA